MRIEILVGNSEEPLIYPLNKPKLTVGSAETCDIIIDAPNISRKHVQILVEGDSYFVIDQGSTNGTFINEERLVPGRRTEFTSFFPVRLGDEVLITLLSDEESSTSGELSLDFPKADEDAPPTSLPQRGRDESTKMISLRDLQKAKTSDLVTRREKIVKKKARTTGKTEAKASRPKSKRAQEKSRMRRIQFLVLLILGGAAYVNFYVMEPTKEPEVAKIGEEIDAPKQAAQPVVEPPKEVSKLIPENELIPRDRIQGLLTDIKCTLELEIYLCQRIYQLQQGQFGVVRVGTVLHILADGTFFMEEAKRLLPPLVSDNAEGTISPEAREAYEKNARLVASAIYLLRAVPKDLDYQLFADTKLSFALFTKDPEGYYQLEVVAAILPSSLQEVKSKLEEVHLTNVKKIGVTAVEFVTKLYRVY